MAEWQALAAAAAAAEAAAQDRLPLVELAAQKQQLLRGLLPDLDAAASESAEVQTQAHAALAAQLAGTASIPTPPPSRLSRALTLVNIAWFVGCVLLVAAVVSLAGVYLAALVMLIPLLAWEAIGYAASLWVLHAAMHSAPGTAPYVGLTGLLMLTATVGGSLALHLAERIKNSETAAATLMGGFALLYGLVAVRLQARLGAGCLHCCVRGYISSRSFSSSHQVFLWGDVECLLQPRRATHSHTPPCAGHLAGHAGGVVGHERPRLLHLRLPLPHCHRLPQRPAGALCRLAGPAAGLPALQGGWVGN
jgi:hypothetical protein